MRSPPILVALICFTSLVAGGSAAESARVPGAETASASGFSSGGTEGPTTKTALAGAPDEEAHDPPDPNENPLPLDAPSEPATNTGPQADSAPTTDQPGAPPNDGNKIVSRGDAAAPGTTVDAKKAPPIPKRKSRTPPLFQVGLNLTTSSTSPVPIPLGVEGKIAIFAELRLLDVDLTHDFALFARGKVAGAYAQGTSHYRASYVPFSDKGGIAIVGERYQFGPDISLGMRWSHIEAAVDVGLRGGNEVGIARYVGARASVGVRYVLDMGIGIGAVYEVQHAMSLGDVVPGWTSSTSGFGLRLSYGI